MAIRRNALTKADYLRKALRILEQDFRRAYNRGQLVEVSAAAPEHDETLWIICENVIYKMELGSDDDEFCFNALDGQKDIVTQPQIRFPISKEWLEAGNDYAGEAFDEHTGERT